MPQPPPSVCTRSVTSVALPTHGDGGGCCRVLLSPFDADSLEALLPAFYRFAGALVYSPEEEEEEEEGSLSIVVEAGGGVAFVEAEAFVASVVRSPRGMMAARLGPRFAMQQQPMVFASPPPPPPQ
ncbi:hypothetical protein [Oryza sativa Japonica Group]|uniref:Uncharacterized protein n=1 Tax=Oryza sativa subsp. japonica TaxID=39947 RepID=Q5VQF4_ORYSJ|nr:hypothetical protein [Oryza sativa Japonica Group]